MYKVSGFFQKVVFFFQAKIAVKQFLKNEIPPPPSSMAGKYELLEEVQGVSLVPPCHQPPIPIGPDSARIP